MAGIFGICLIGISFYGFNVYRKKQNSNKQIVEITDDVERVEMPIGNVEQLTSVQSKRESVDNTKKAAFDDSDDDESCIEQMFEPGNNTETLGNTDNGRGQNTKVFKVGALTKGGEQHHDFSVDAVGVDGGDELEGVSEQLFVDGNEPNTKQDSKTTTC